MKPPSWNRLLFLTAAVAVATTFFTGSRPVGLVHIDAHCDTSGPYEGSKFHHGGPFRQAVLDGVLDPARMAKFYHPLDVFYLHRMMPLYFGKCSVVISVSQLTTVAKHSYSQGNAKGMHHGRD